MSASFAFYIHHHGSGHLMRALAIASRLGNARITFLGSGLSRFQAIIPEYIHCVHLPTDVPGPDDFFAVKENLSFLHYAPFNVENVARRAAVITAALHALFPAVLIVDVSVEVTVLATLCGTPTVVVRQNGDRDDNAHLHAYECAQLLIAPSPQSLMDVSAHAWVNEKTFFTGGFSKYSGSGRKVPDADPDALGVMVGSGGTSFNGSVVNALAMRCVGKAVHVIGEIAEPAGISAANVVFHGQLDNPLSVLSKCNVVIGNAGHNTVMEMADLGKKFVCIPEERPFREQLRKAELLEKNGMAVVVRPEDLPQTDWKSIVDKAHALPENSWQGVISGSALDAVAQRLREIWDRNFLPGSS